MTWILIGIFLALVLIGMPISHSMLISSLLTLVICDTIPLNVMVTRISYGLDSFTLLAIPLFLFAGELMNAGGITKRIMLFCQKLLGHIKGGLCHVSILACMIFAGVSGSSNADTAAVSSIAVPMMRESGYDDDVSVSVVACGGTIGPIIPPSIPLVIYSSLTGLSIGKLLLGGILPGILFGIALMVVSSIYAYKRDYPTNKRASFKEISSAFTSAILALLAPIVLLFGITSGIFTATEAGGALAIYCLIVSAIYKELSWKNIMNALKNTAVSSASILLILAAGSLFGYILAIDQFPTHVSNLIMSVSTNGTVIILVIIFIMLIVGLFIEGLASMTILVPVFVPIIEAIGYDPYQFAILFLLCISIGAITPPVGMVLFTACGVTNTPLSRVGKTIYIFALGLLAATLIQAFVPGLTLWIPNMFM